MKVLAKHVLHEFANEHADVATQLGAWVAEVQEATWRSPLDVKKRYAHASLLSNNRVIFNIKGNSYRLEVTINYPAQIVLVNRIGTHAEYSRW